MNKRFFTFLAVLSTIVLLVLGNWAAPARSLLALSATVVATPDAESLGTPADLVVTDAETATAKTVLGDGLIGVLACTLETQYHAQVAQGIVDHLKAAGFHVELFDSQVDTNRQIDAIESFTTRGAKVLVICEFDPPSVEKALKAAAASGIKIIEYAGRATAALGGITISVEDSALGRAAGQYAGQLITQELGGKAAVAVLDYNDIPSVKQRGDALVTALFEAAPGATIVGRIKGGTPENGQTNMESLLQNHPEINVVVSINDAGALGAIRALEGAGKKPDAVMVIGIDGDSQARQDITNGYFYRATVDTSPDLTATMTAEAVIKVLAGSTIPSSIAVPVTLITHDTLMQPTAAATLLP